ncbi:MAG: hypothetical protein ABI036_04285 [Fibrobacteria bacterium]
MPQLRHLSPILIILALAFSLSEAKRLAKAAATQPRGNCETLSDSLLAGYQAGDPAYLSWDFSTAKCDSSQLYQAYYYQGIGFLFLSDWKEALAYLNAARKIGGPRDEEILYHLWTVYRKLDKYQEMERLTVELHQRYPSSLFLLEILDQWKSVHASTHPWSWGYSSKAAWAGVRTPYLNHIITNRLTGETGQKWGLNQLRESGSMSLKSKWDQRFLQGFQANLGLEFQRRGFSAEADWGAGFESRQEAAAVIFSNGAGSLLADSNWNFQQGRVAAGYSHTAPSGWNLSGNASLYQFSPDWRVLGLSHSQTFMFTDFMLMGYLDLQKHWIEPDTALQAAGYQDLDGMLTFSFSLTPYFYLGKHSLGTGATYYLAKMHSSGGAGAEKVEGNEWQHSLSGTASYGYDLRSWCRLAFSLSYGYDFNKTPGTAFTKKPVYGMDAGFSLSY